MTEKEKLYNNDDIFERDFKKLYAQVTEKYNTQKLKKYIHYKLVYNLYIGLRNPKIKRKSLKFRVLLIEYLKKLISEEIFIEGNTWHNELTSKNLFEKVCIYPVGSFLGTYQNYSAITFLCVNYYAIVIVVSLIGYYLLQLYGIILGVIIGILCYFHFQKKKKQHKIYGFKY